MSDHRPSVDLEDGPATPEDPTGPASVTRPRPVKSPARPGGLMTLTLAASTVVSVVALALVAGAAPDAIRDVPLLGELMSHRGWVGPSDVARNAPLPGEHDRENRPTDADAEVADPDRRRIIDPDAAAGTGHRTPGREDADPARPPAAGGPVGPAEPGNTPPGGTPAPEGPATPPPAAQEPGRGPIGAYIGCTADNPDPKCHEGPGHDGNPPPTTPGPDPGKPSGKPAPSKLPTSTPPSSKPPTSKPEPSKPEPSAKPDKESDGNKHEKDKDEDNKKDHDDKGEGKSEKKDGREPAGDAGKGAD